MWDLTGFGKQTAVIQDDGQSLTYAKLNEEANRFYQSIGGRCLIFILCRNSIGSLLGYVSSLQNRVVPLLISADLETESLKSLVDAYHPSYLWVPEDIDIDFIPVTKKYGAFSYSLLATSFDSSFQLNDYLALLLTTSGSTGSPKFVRQSYENICSNTHSIVEYLGITSSERPITTLPMNYTYGLSIINTHLMMGATILMTDYSLMQKEFWVFFKEQGATSFGGVPYTFEILNRLRFERMDLPTLRTVTQAGGKLSSELQKKFTELAIAKHFDFIVMYGQCEATARMSYLPMKDATAHCGSIGIAIPGGKFKVVDDKGETITKPHTPGELVYVGANVTLGYATMGADLVKGDERHGELHTGDIAQFDEDGFYYIVGRMKRFLKVYGNRVNLDELEQLLKNRFVSIDCAVSGNDDHVVIFITGDENPSELVNYLVHKTGLNRISFKVKKIEVIPKNDSGKTLYAVLEQS